MQRTTTKGISIVSGVAMISCEGGTKQGNDTETTGGFTGGQSSHGH